jgi:hypothetical protein
VGAELIGDVTMAFLGMLYSDASANTEVHSLKKWWDMQVDEQVGFRHSMLLCDDLA